MRAAQQMDALAAVRTDLQVARWIVVGYRIRQPQARIVAGHDVVHDLGTVCVLHEDALADRVPHDETDERDVGCGNRDAVRQVRGVDRGISPAIDRQRLRYRHVFVVGAVADDDATAGRNGCDSLADGIVGGAGAVAVSRIVGGLRRYIYGLQRDGGVAFCRPREDARQNRGAQRESSRSHAHPPVSAESSQAGDEFQ
jgi:hypothetical protein